MGTPEILIVVGIIVLVFGASQLPKLARSLGQAKAEFEKGQSEGTAPSSKAETDKSDKD